MTEEKIYSLLHSSPSGLTAEEAQNRLSTYGYNQISEEKSRHILVELLLNFKNPLIFILLCVVGISFFLGETANAFLVLCMVVLSAILNFYQEHRANQAAQKLKNKVAHTTNVIRDGREQELAARMLVPGDLIVLNAGDLIPADARIIEAKDLFINQSALTGESFPVEKNADELKTTTQELSEMTNIAFAGTSVTTGFAKAIILRTGGSTEFGKIAQKVTSLDQENEFTKGIGKFSVMILRIILLFVLFIFLANALIKQDILQALTFSIAVAVGLTPEFLPMIMTVTMSKGSQKMAQKGVIVKKLTAIPTFGSMEILCTDKTGTLTEDRITLVKYLDSKGKESEDVFLCTYLNSFHQTGITNPMDSAVLQYKDLDVNDYKKIDEIPFDFERKRMSVVVKKGEQYSIITKGAPEEVMATTKIDPKMQASLTKIYQELSKEGYRVLAVAQKTIKGKKSGFTKADETDLVFVGFAAFLDPAKEGVRQSIDDLEAMGVEIKVVTGDNELVTKKICETIGINIKGILVGHDVNNLSDEQLYTRAVNTTIFARFSPVQKERLIEVLKRHGKVVGYMGDGINDSPSLKAADVGISVSNGVDVAKESASIILTTKSLNELKNGVIEGRKTFGNTMKYVLMGLSSNFGNMFSVLGAVIFLPFLPMLPIQILLNNFLYDISQVTIPTDNVDDEMIRLPKRWNISYIKKFMLIFGPISSLFDYLSFIVLYLFFRNIPGAFQTGWFIESLATQTLVIHVIRTRKLPFIQSRASIPLIISTLSVVTLGWLLPYSPLGHYFGFVPLPLPVTLILAAIVALYLVTAQIGTRIFYNRVDKANSLSLT